jgi:methylated-DNA-[protein]-cysteine S-methyltransferase
MPPQSPPPRVTPFQQRVYEALCAIPRGRVATYAGLAAALGCGSPRAVGQALRANPFAPRIPCHRVVRSDGTLGGYQGRTRGAALRRKASLLRAEGVPVENSRVAGWPAFRHVPRTAVF